MSTQFKETDVSPHAFGKWNNDLVFLAPNILTDYYVLSDKVKIETSTSLCFLVEIMQEKLEH